MPSADLFTPAQLTAVFTTSDELSDKLDYLHRLHSHLETSSPTNWPEWLATGLSHYNATLSESDQHLLLFFRLADEQGGHFGALKPWLWGAKADQSRGAVAFSASLWRQPSVDKIIQILDSGLLLKSITSFPFLRTLEATDVELVCFENDTSRALYDPVFLLTAFAHLLSIEYKVDPLVFLRRGALSYCLRALSSSSEGLRRVAYTCLQELHAQVVPARFQSKQLFLYFLEWVRDTVEEECMQLPGITSLFFARAALVLSNPDDKLFTVVSGYVFSRPQTNTRTIPMFTQLFFSGTMSHLLERHWILEILASGFEFESDYTAVKQSRIMDNLLAYCQSPISDKTSENLILQFLVKCVSHSFSRGPLITEKNVHLWLRAVLPAEEDDSNRAKMIRKCLTLIRDSAECPPHFQRSFWGVV